MFLSFKKRLCVFTCLPFHVGWMPEHVANHNINDVAADGQCDSFKSGLDVMAYSFSVLDSDVEIFRFLLMCQPLVFFPSSFVIQAKVLRVIIGSKWRSFEHPSH